MVVVVLELVVDEVACNDDDVQPSDAVEVVRVADETAETVVEVVQPVRARHSVTSDQAVVKRVDASSDVGVRDVGDAKVLPRLPEINRVGRDNGPLAAVPAHGHVVEPAVGKDRRGRHTISRGAASSGTDNLLRHEEIKRYRVRRLARGKQG